MSCERDLFIVAQFGGELVHGDDGSMSYAGGEAHLLDIEHNMSFDQFKSEIAKICNKDISTLTFKYLLPTNKRTLISISNDKDLRCMVAIHQDAVPFEVYIMNRESGVLNALDTTASRSSRNTIVESSTTNALNDDQPRALVVSWENIITGVGQEFMDVYQFREALRKYAITRGFIYDFIKNDSDRVTAKCKTEGCLWRIHASKVSNAATFRIKTLNNEHLCGEGIGIDGHPRATKHWVASVIKDRVRDKPDYTPKDIISDLHQDYGVKLKYLQAWRGKVAAKEQIQGMGAGSYEELSRYCERIMETNPGSAAILEASADSRFHRIFVSFHACIHGFQQGCRPLLFLDGTVLRMKYQGTFLSATTVDGNDDIFPVAFAIVDAETYDNWQWFLLQLKLLLSSSCSITFVSDKQNGLKDAVPEIFGDNHHAFCLRHLTERLKKEFKGSLPHAEKEVIADMVTRAAYTCRLKEFNTCIEKIKSIFIEAADWVLASEPNHWANLFFKGSRYNQLTSNIVESFTAWISDKRNLPIINLVDSIRLKLMALLFTRYEDSNKWHTRLTPKAEENLQKEVDYSRSLQVFRSSNFLFEVHDDTVNVVDIEKRECTCHGWKLTGLPCRHAIGALNHMGGDVYDYCERYFCTECYRLTYSKPMNPILDGNYTDDAYPVVEPLRTRRPPGRPKRKQIESQNLFKRELHCSRCDGLGHNRATCKAPV